MSRALLPARRRLAFASPGLAARAIAADVSHAVGEIDCPDADDDVVRRYLQTRDQAAFGEIVRRYQDRVFRLAVAVLGPGADADAEDVTQETFLRAHQRLESFRGESRFGTWLYRLAFNLAVDRRRLARWSKPHVGGEGLEAASGQPVPPAAGDPFRSAAGAERARVIAAALDRLPEAARTVLHLHYWLGSSVEEISELLRMPVGTVKSWLHRGRRMVHAALRRKGIDDVG